MTRRLPKERRFKRHVFLSMPNVRTARQEELVVALYAELDRRHLYARTVGVTDSGVVSPLSLVRKTMRRCHGALILGLVQGKIDSGTSKPGTRERKSLRNFVFPTPWNQLEAGIAFAMGLPLLIVRERGIGGGVFDPGAAGDRFVHPVQLRSPRPWKTGELKSTLDAWEGEVVRHARRARRNRRPGKATQRKRA
jgi:hypothetical protein